MSGAGGQLAPFGTPSASESTTSAATRINAPNATGNCAGGAGGISSTTLNASGGNGAPGIIIITPLF
jgi:hypothetical protein